MNECFILKCSFLKFSHLKCSTYILKSSILKYFNLECSIINCSISLCSIYIRSILKYSFFDTPFCKSASFMNDPQSLTTFNHRNLSTKCIIVRQQTRASAVKYFPASYLGKTTTTLTSTMILFGWKILILGKLYSTVTRRASSPENRVSKFWYVHLIKATFNLITH